MKAFVTTRPVGTEGRQVAVRVVFERAVFDTDGRLTKMEALNDPKMYSPSSKNCPKHCSWRPMTSDRLKRNVLLLIPLLLLLAAVRDDHDRLLDMDTSQVQLRSIQSRPSTRRTRKRRCGPSSPPCRISASCSTGRLHPRVVAASKARADSMQMQVAASLRSP